MFQLYTALGAALFFIWCSVYFLYQYVRIFLNLRKVSSIIIVYILCHWLDILLLYLHLYFEDFCLFLVSNSSCTFLSCLFMIFMGIYVCLPECIYLDRICEGVWGDQKRSLNPLNWNLQVTVPDIWPWNSGPL